MEILLAALSAVAAAFIAAKAMEQQKKAEEESRVRIPIRADEPRIERRER